MQPMSWAPLGPGVLSPMGSLARLWGGRAVHRLDPLPACQCLPHVVCVGAAWPCFLPWLDESLHFIPESPDPSHSWWDVWFGNSCLSALPVLAVGVHVPCFGASPSTLPCGWTP